jgi:hypothetical protein
MPLTAAAGSISLAVDYLRTTLADSAAFRTWAGAANQAAALARIYYESLPPPANGNEHTLAELAAYRPYALVWVSPEDGFRKRHISQAASFGYAQSGTMLFRMLQTVDPAIANDPAEISRRFINTIGTIFDEFEDLCGLAGYLAIESMEIDFGPYRGDPDEKTTQGDYIGIDINVSWGIESA